MQLRQQTLFLLMAVMSCASPSAAQSIHTYTYDVDGLIDSNDFLIMQGATLQWHHVDTGGAAVGRHGGNNFATIISSSFDGVSQMDAVNWTPDWPQPVPNNIRFNALSSVYSSLSPALPISGFLSVSVSVISGRGSLLIDQLPTDSNANTAIIHFKDGFNGSAWLDGLITISTPEPTGIALAALAWGLLATQRQRRPRLM